MTFISSWQSYVLSAILLFNIGLLLYSIKKLLRLNEIQHVNRKFIWLILLSSILALLLFYFLYHIFTHTYEVLHIVIALASALVALFVWLATRILQVISIDLSKSTAVEHYLNTHDNLTGLPNLSFFDDQLGQVLSNAKEEKYKVALLLIDLNRFQLINETLGYFAGDTMLREISQRIRSSLRKTDLIARLGGDEFAVLINPVVAQGHMHTISKNLVDSIKEPLAVEGKPTDVGVSIGIALFPDHANNGLELIEKARIAMLETKKSGDSTLVYDPIVLSNTFEDIHIIGMLQRAVQQQQLKVLYQPQVRLHDMKLISVEALMRWQHPIYGILDPRHFIPYAERAGLIYEINLWLLQEVIKLLEKWRVKNIQLSIAINITANGFLNKEFQQELNKILKNKPWLSKLLKIELTETSSIDDTGKISTSMANYKKQGFVFCLDDYGTKYASLEYLSTLPFDELKIDQSFMINAITDDDSKAIIQHAKEIAKQLGLVTTAEGIENKGILSLAQKYNIDFGQGYYFSPAVTAIELESHIQKYGFDANAYVD